MYNQHKTKTENTVRGIAVMFMTAVLIPALVFAGSTTNKGANPNGKPFIELGGQIVEVEGEISSLQDQVDAVVGEAADLEGRVAANEAAITSLQTTSASLQAQIDASAADIFALQVQVSDLEDENNNLQQQIFDLGDADGALQALIDTNSGLITTLNQSINDLSVTLQDQIDNNLLLIGMLEDEIDSINSELLEKQNRVNGLCADGSAIQQILADGSVICESVSGGGAGSLESSTATRTIPLANFGQNFNGSATCPAGWIVTGGGWRGHSIQIDASLPTATGWFVRGFGSFVVDIYASCARVQP